MKSLILPQWLRCLGLALAGSTLSLMALSAYFEPSLAASQKNKLAEKMQELQQSGDRWIQVNLSRQRLIAWEGGKPVYAIVISSGKRSTPTRTGTFSIKSKHRYARMRGADYDVANVPYTMYYQRGYAIHGTYWHRKFGTPISHGCVNVAVNHSKWLYDWASVGTPIVVHN